MTKTAEHVTALCCLKAASQVWYQHKRGLEYRLKQAQTAEKPEIPEEPTLLYLYRILYVPIVLLVLLALFLAYLVIRVVIANWFLGILVAFGGGFLIFCMIGLICMMGERIEYKRGEHQKALKKYEEEANSYEKRLARWQNMVDSIPKLRSEIRALDDDLGKIEDKLERVARKNIVPMQYRDLNALMFLHRWFESYESEDMDFAIRSYIRKCDDRIRAMDPMYTKDDYFNRYRELKNTECEDVGAFLKTLNFS